MAGSLHRRRLSSYTGSALAIAVLALLLWGVHRSTGLNQDTIVMLDWGRDLSGGGLPDYTTDFAAPTPHPLSTAIYGLFALGGDSFAYASAVALSYLAYAWLVWVVVLLGRSVRGWAAGLVAGATLLVSAELGRRGMNAGQEVPAAALILTATLLEVRRRQRGLVVVFLLIAAGLIRPEAWPLAALYCIWLGWDAGPRRRWVLTACALAAPVLWLATDWIVTGDAFYSKNQTVGYVAILDRPTGLHSVPHELVTGLDRVLGGWVVLGGLAGLGIALAAHNRRAAAILTVALGTSLVAFAVLGAQGLSLLPRYLFVVSAVLAIFFGVATAGWTSAPRGVMRAAWGAAAVGLLAVTAVVHVPVQVDALRDASRRYRAQGRAMSDLRAVAKAAPGICRPIEMPDERIGRLIAYAFDVSERDMARPLTGDRKVGSFLQPRGADAFAFAPKGFRVVGPPRGQQKVAASDSWALYSRPPGCPRPRRRGLAGGTG